MTILVQWTRFGARFPAAELTANVTSPSTAATAPGRCDVICGSSLQETSFLLGQEPVHDKETHLCSEIQKICSQIQKIELLTVPVR